MTRLDALRKRLIHTAREQVRERYSQTDAHLIRAVNALDDLDQIYNLLFEHCREWYGIHYPELERIEKNPENYLALAENTGNRENYSTEKLPDTDKKNTLIENAANSMGSPLSQNQWNAIKRLAALAKQTKNERNELLAFVEKETLERFPNVSALATPLLAARLITKAGSAKNLAFMASSGIQTLGAEKAMFAHLKNNSKPPKHGLIYNHALIKTSPPSERGKIARALAGKLAIAIKQDYFAEHAVADNTLAKQLENRIERIKKNPAKKRP